MSLQVESADRYYEEWRDKVPIKRPRPLVLFGARLAFNRTVALLYRIHLEQR